MPLLSILAYWRSNSSFWAVWAHRYRLGAGLEVSVVIMASLGRQAGGCSEGICELGQ
jgi:hypothetical protein